MNIRGVQWTVALPLLCGLASPAHAGWGDAQLTCHRCQQAPAVAYYAPAPCGPTVVAYAAPVCQCRCRCGPIRRLFGCCKPRCCCAPAAVAVPVAPAPVVVPVAPPVTVTPACPTFPGAAPPPPPPIPTPVPAPPTSYNRSYPPSGLGSYRPLPPLTPPTPPPPVPVRLDRIASYQAESGPAFQLVPSAR